MNVLQIEKKAGSQKHIEKSFSHSGLGKRCSSITSLNDKIHINMWARYLIQPTFV
jgi:hypothetical protein